MAEYSLSVADLFSRAFGLDRGKPYDPGAVGTPGYRTEQAYSGLSPALDSEGTEFTEMRNTVAATLPNGQRLFMPMRLGGVLLPNEPSVTVASRKNIVETALVGSTRRGTVKELISIEDWAITIRGVAINFDSKLVYPEDQVKALNDLYERNEALTVECALTSLLGIDRLVIREVFFPEMIGVQHAQAYQFICVSDEDFILEL